MSRPTPIEVAAQAVRTAWDVPAAGEPDRYPSTQATAEAVLKALDDHGFRIVDAAQHDGLMARARHYELEARRLERIAFRADL